MPQFVVSAGFPILSRAARSDKERLAYGLQKMMDACILLGALFAVTLSVGAPFVIAVVAGDSFAPAADVLRIQGISLAGTFLASFLGFALVSLHRHREVLIMSSVGLVVLVGASFVLIPELGAQGAAISIVLAELVLATTGWRLLRRDHGPKLSLIVLGKVVVAAVVAVAPAIVLPVVPALVCSVIIFSGIAIGLGAVPAELWTGLRQRS